jgi:hypothetical protein
LDGGDAAGGWDENGRVRFGGMAWSAVVIRADQTEKTLAIAFAGHHSSR